MMLEREHGNNGQAGDALGRTRSHLHEAPPPTGKTRFTTRASTHATTVGEYVSLVSRGG